MFRPLLSSTRSSIPRLTRTICNATPTKSNSSKRFLNIYRASVLLTVPVLAIVVPTFSGNSLLCESDRNYARSNSGDEIPLPPPTAEYTSILSIKELSFSTAAGICTGIFIVKGAKFIAFLLGGSFIMLQYLSSRSLLTVEWNTISNGFEKGLKNRGGLRGISGWGIDFLTANIQGRGAFIGGLGLGMRLG